MTKRNRRSRASRTSDLHIDPFYDVIIPTTSTAASLPKSIAYTYADPAFTGTPCLTFTEHQLAEHDRLIAEQAWDEGYTYLSHVRPDWTVNPYAKPQERS